jgi:hypothetical protein
MSEALEWDVSMFHYFDDFPDSSANEIQILAQSVKSSK